jgi:hypothetical protein
LCAQKGRERGGIVEMVGAAGVGEALEWQHGFLTAMLVLLAHSNREVELVKNRGGFLLKGEVVESGGREGIGGVVGHTPNGWC